MKNNKSKENRKTKYGEYYSRMEKQKSTFTNDIVSNETERTLMILRLKVNVALYSVTNLSPDDQDKTYDT